jgi:predicted aldo/keto reductase-like oxidoreductase
MEYRVLGKTGLNVSVIGFGTGMLGTLDAENAVKVVRRTIELGMNYFDTARSYRDSEIKLGLAVEKDRESYIISSKTHTFTKEDAWREIHESLERLKTDYLDNYYLHNLRGEADIEKRCILEGPLGALVEAKEEGIIRHIGCTSHLSDVLIKALDRFDFETILIPMNIVEQEPLDKLIPLCEKKGVGVTIMKPVATALLPGTIALKWLRNQPIASAVPGISTMEEAEENAMVGNLENYNLTLEETAEVQRLRNKLENVRCRICFRCEPCPQNIQIASLLGTDVMYDHYRNMGAEAFKTFPWDTQQVSNEIPGREEKISNILSCTECGECENNCPYGLPIIRMLQSMVEPMRDMLHIYRQDLKI